MAKLSENQCGNFLNFYSTQYINAHFCRHGYVFSFKKNENKREECGCATCFKIEKGEAFCLKKKPNKLYKSREMPSLFSKFKHKQKFK